MVAEKEFKEFKIPTDLLKQFQSEIRIVARELHPNGYIIFDRMMLQKVLLSDDTKIRKELAEQLDRLDKSGGQLVIMAK